MVQDRFRGRDEGTVCRGRLFPRQKRSEVGRDSGDLRRGQEERILDRRGRIKAGKGCQASRSQRVRPHAGSSNELFKEWEVVMKTLNQRLNDFWFEPAPAERLAMLRILVGAFSFVYFAFYEPDIFLKVAKTDPNLWAPVGVNFGGPVDPKVFPWIFDAAILSTVLFTIGLWHRVTGPIAAFMVTWMYGFQSSWSIRPRDHEGGN